MIPEALFRLFSQTFQTIYRFSEQRWKQTRRPRSEPPRRLSPTPPSKTTMTFFDTFKFARPRPSNGVPAMDPPIGVAPPSTGGPMDRWMEPMGPPTGVATTSVAAIFLSQCPVNDLIRLCFYYRRIVNFFRTSQHDRECLFRIFR